MTNRSGAKGHVGGAAGLLSNPCGFSGREKKKENSRGGKLKMAAGIENANDWSLFFLYVCDCCGNAVISLHPMTKGHENP
jgi:hypothetical protein